ncbi:hypothetical protein POV27_09385 [Aureisphaera galaxeae]|uniref:hypothetical protein n=1 Tax=Aureisphaera galaxeae TaxID=1538023 RepID=UPI0023501B22|nr:hypothetical protein [Aureisphaera galaxeae]MDC8004262.1 hypothetical protein [Aureisphaera galaxeae]
MRIKNSLIIAITLSLIFSACKGKSEAVSDAKNNSFQDAIIRNYGDVALDGCGYVVDVSSTIYMPKNLSSEFHKDGLEVRIKFKELDRVNCGLVKDAHLGMLIEEIEMK